MSCTCNLKVGDEVDWHRYSWRLRRHTTQVANWHGKILRDLGTQTLGAQTGHVFEVEWTKSNFWGKSFTKEPEGGTHVAQPPVHIQKEVCIELMRCSGPGNPWHPPQLR